MKASLLILIATFSRLVACGPNLWQRDGPVAQDPPGSSPQGCTPSKTSGVGFKAMFYPYTFNDFDDAQSIPFLEGGYKVPPPFAVVEGVTDVNFAFISKTGREPGDVETIYGVSFDITHFFLTLSGYFLAPETGLYTFSLTHIDDAMLVRIGAGSAFGCCNTQSTSPGDYFMYAFDGGNPNTFSLIQGYYYPISIAYVNVLGSALLDFQVTTPSGKTLTTFENVFQVVDTPDSPCPAPVTTTIPWTGSDYSTTTLSTGSVKTVEIFSPEPTTTTTSYWLESITRTITEYPSGTPGTITVKVEEPNPSVSTVTTGWTGSSTSTTTASGPSGTTVIVEVPPYVPSTITTGWTGSSTSTTTASGPSGNTVIIETPSVGPTTITTGWTGSHTSTTTASGPSGTTVIIETPSVGPSTITTGWTGSGTSTTTSVGPSGTTVVIVETPPASIETITTGWTGSHTSTTTASGPSGTTVIIETPSVGPSTITTGWTGSGTSTTTSVGPSGTTVVIVETPSVGPTTITTGWTGSGTSTTTSVGPSGTTVIVETPSVGPTTITTGWTGSSTFTTTASGPSGNTVIIETPSVGPTTITTGWTGSSTSTTTTVGPSGTTVIVETPSTHMFSTWLWSNSSSTSAIGSGTSLSSIPTSMLANPSDPSMSWATMTSVVSNPTTTQVVTILMTPSNGFGSPSNTQQSGLCSSGDCSPPVQSIVSTTSPTIPKVSPILPDNGSGRIFSSIPIAAMLLFTLPFI